ncbi:clavesin-1 [Tribolium castaneum]|uniref:Clavesin-1-like Protein n=1 Tax=Tribolium castaneum TaxID=7070 RepID=D2A667_TRICA|nr:PREDICTED: clavesin-1 [Tribolium castaneum]EFA04969.1 Clavesin-1-like Protein [Tribolium castaneum]|eukprot:XP_973699.1 PREDICTED: clavesin-1 [Tribolium castaneum]
MVLPYEYKAQTIVDEGRTSHALIQEVKNWLSTTDFPQLQDESIVLFLLSCQNNVEETQKTIRAFFKIKSESPDIFQNRDMDDEVLQRAMKVVTCVSIPTRLSNNQTVIHFFKLNDTNYRNFDLITSMKLAFMVIDISQRRNPPSDLIVVIDMKGATLMHLTCIKLGAIKKFIDFLQEAMPLRIQQIHVLNANYIFDKALAIGRVFMKNELMEMIHAHSPKLSMDEIYEKCVPAACLPKEYGGELPTCEELNRRTVEQFRELKKFFEAEEMLISSFKSS